jgi:hypothetical protein
LALVVFSVIEKTIAAYSSSSDTLNLLDLDDRTRAGFHAMMSEIIVTRRNVEMADRHF